MRRVKLPPIEPETKTESKVCDYPDCTESGVHRAPRSREDLNSHYWFCLAHARAYNASWDYFDGMSQEDIQAYQQSATTWHRPTWQMNTRDRGHQPSAFNYEFNVLSNHAEPEVLATRTRTVSAPVRRALEVLILEPTACLQDVKSRYKTLAKRFHPDTNGGCRDSEEQLKIVNQAYTLLLPSGYQ